MRVRVPPPALFNRNEEEEMTAGQLRKILEALPDDAEVKIKADSKPMPVQLNAITILAGSCWELSEVWLEGEA